MQKTSEVRFLNSSAEELSGGWKNIFYNFVVTKSVDVLNCTKLTKGSPHPRSEI